MNTVIYARYSAGPRQTDQSIEGQLRVCTDFCKQRGLTVIDTYCDRHISGRTDERPEFQRLIADAKRKKFEAVVVYKTDRFARNKYDSAVYKRELKRNGIQIFYAAEAIPDGPEGIILESLMEGLAEYYSAELAQKIKRGMHESALKCQSTGSGRPLGYRVDEQKHFQIDPESAQTVQTIFEQYIKGESNAAICEFLNNRGLRTAQGKPFNKNSINRIIKNRKYIGEYRYHDIVVKGGMPAIISKDTFNLAQAEMERRRTRKAPKSPKAEYLLAGRLFCGHCKGPMQGVSGTGKSGNKWYYYYCGNTRGKNKTCDKKQVSRDRLERAVVDFTVRYILQEEVLEELAKKVHAAQERQNDTASEIAFYEKKLADNKKSIANVLRAIESGAATQTLPARLQELENEQAVILGELSFLKGKRLAFTEDQILFALMKHLEPYPGESEQDYRRRIISDFVSEVYLYDDRLLIYFNISSEDGKLKSADLSNIEGGEFDEGLISSTNTILHLLDDWLYFFDNVAFEDNQEWCGCYCMCYHWTQQLAKERAWNCDKKCATLNRAKAIDFIQTGRMQGYLAYSDGKVVGWCNSNEKKAYDNVNFNFAEQVPDNGEKIKSVVCFAIAPENRGKGIATALLKYVCENAKNDGFEYVEAYPFEHNENAAYHGPTDLYEKNGFVFCNRIEGCRIVRKKL